MAMIERDWLTLNYYAWNVDIYNPQANGDLERLFPIGGRASFSVR